MSFHIFPKQVGYCGNKQYIITWCKRKHRSEVWIKIAEESPLLAFPQSSTHWLFNLSTKFITHIFLELNKEIQNHQQTLRASNDVTQMGHPAFNWNLSQLSQKMKGQERRACNQCCRWGGRLPSLQGHIPSSTRHGHYKHTALFLPSSQFHSPSVPQQLAQRVSSPHERPSHALCKFNLFINL